MPSFPQHGFSGIAIARKWVDAFVDYYNNDHHHSSLKFLTPNQRHNGSSEEILTKRKEILENARAKKNRTMDRSDPRLHFGASRLAESIKREK